MPDQSPEAVQDVAPVDDQFRVEDPLYETEVGLAVMETVTAAGRHLLLPEFQEEPEAQVALTVV